MIVKEHGGKTESAGIQLDIKVGISDNLEDQLMIMNILSNQLYSDKISACWREYGCNAADANVMAGRANTPIEITLPTQLDPTAIIRDFGDGLTEEEVVHIYSKFGASTKRTSNLVTGMLGVGAKAGLAYGDSFAVVSYNKGTKTHYNFYRDKGVPKMAILMRGKTSEPDGVEIRVPVRKADIQEFHNRAETTFRHFKVRPKVKGGKLDWQDDETVVQGTGWRLTAIEHSYAIMGNVGYTINTHHLPSDFPPDKKSLLDCGVELEFEIGELSVAANRESLEYTDDTVLALSKKLGTCRQELADNFNKEIKAAASLWDAHKVYGAMFDKRGSYRMRTVRDSLDGKIKWNGIDITSSDFNIENRDKNHYKKEYESIHILEYQRPGNYSKRMYKRDNPGSVEVNNSYLVLNNNKTGAVAVSRIRYFFEQNPTVRTMVVFTFEDAKDKAAFMKKRYLDQPGVPWKNMMDLPKPPVVPGTSGSAPSQHRSKHSARTLAFNEKSTDYMDPKSLYWETTLADKSEEELYMPIETYLPIPTLWQGGNDTLRLVIQSARKLLFLKPNQKVLGIKRRWNNETSKTEFATKLGDKWRPFETVMREKVEALFKAFPVKLQQFADYQAAVKHEIFVDPAIAPQLLHGMARTLLEEYARMKGYKVADLYVLYTRAPKLFSNITFPKPTVDLAKAQKEVVERYPMLEYSDYTFKHCKPNTTPANKAVEYINLVETISAGKTSTTQTATQTKP